jgi:Zn-finger protein
MPAPKKCETIGCPNPGVRSLTIAPGTTVWLCTDCIILFERDQASDVGRRYA